MSSEHTTPDTTEYAIEVNGLSKCYQIYDKPSDRLKQMLMRGRKQYYKEFWALKDVSFKIKKGETVGIIGRNGSGKSTLLQMICGTLNPTGGEVKVNGRVAALLELGAGFNPEFSGVENVYMAASLYGLSKEEVDQRFDAIVTFADIGDHIHQPVKNYSSGMYVRLAFAVIAHVDADILVVDEALAVGDAVFTQKCMRFIRGFAKKGCLLFVSHDVGTISSLCDSAIWLSDGELRMSSSVDDVVNGYKLYCNEILYGSKIRKQNKNVNQEKPINNKDFVNVNKYNGLVTIIDNIDNADGWSTGGAEIVSVQMRPDSGFVFKGNEKITLKIKAKSKKIINKPIIGFYVKDKTGQALFGEHTYFSQSNIECVNADEVFYGVFSFMLPMLVNGDYSMTVSVAEGDPFVQTQHHWLHDAIIINVNSDKLRYGVVGIPFSEVGLFLECNNEE